MGKARSEWKYICNDKQIGLLDNKLSSILEKDIHSDEKNMYVVHSLYFDDFKDSCIHALENGDARKFKWRIRYYNDDVNTLKLEYKVKKYGRGVKTSVPLTISEYEAIMNNDIHELIWNTSKDLLKKFCVDIMMNYFKPKVIIDYERVAYTESNLNIRITFDKNISSSYEVFKFLNRSYIKYPLQNKNMNIVEVKFDDILPGYIRNIITNECGVQTSYSKYYNGRKVVDLV